MKARTKQTNGFRGWAGFLSLVALVLCFVPLFNLLGYEFSAVVGFIAGIGAGHLGVRVVAEARRLGQTTALSGLFTRAWKLSVLMLLPSLLLISANALRVRNCDYWEGLGFFLLIPLISVTYGAAAGVCFGLATRTSKRGVLVWLLWVGASVGLVLHNVLLHPPKFAYHALFGYFPGPIYDEAVAITPTLLVARGITLLQAVCFLTVAQALHDLAGQRLTGRTLFHGRPLRTQQLTLAVVCLTALTWVWTERGKLGIRPTRADIQRELGARFETPHFILYYARGSPVEKEITLLAEDHEFRYTQLREFFGIDVSRKIGSYLYATPEQKKHWMGAKDTEMADPISGEIHIVYSAFPDPSLKHELAHVFTEELRPHLKFRLAVGIWEGIAVAAQWDEGDLTAHQWANGMKQLHRLPDVEGLMSPWGFWTQPGTRAYLAAGSFVRWLIETYGMRTFAQAFSTGSFQRNFGQTLAVLSREWRAFLDHVPLTADELNEVRGPSSHPSIFQKACAHKMASLETEARRRSSLGDYKGARDCIGKMVAFEPAKPQHRWQLVLLDAAQKKWPAVKTGAAAIVQDKQADGRLRLSAREIMGDAEWQMNNLTAAGRAFDAALAQYPMDLTRRVFFKADAVRRDAAVRRYVFEYFAGDHPALRLYYLRELTLHAPDWASGHYFLGRELFNARAWGESLKYLERAETLGLPNQSFATECSRVRGMALYRMEKWDETELAFQRVATLVKREGSRLNAADWQARCRWARAHKR